MTLILIGFTSLEICLYYVIANTWINASKKLEVISVVETGVVGEQEKRFFCFLDIFQILE